MKTCNVHLNSKSRLEAMILTITTMTIVKPNKIDFVYLHTYIIYIHILRHIQHSKFALGHKQYIENI